MNSNYNRYCIILAGGSGQRLWPLSRQNMPKQLIPVLDGKSLLEAAFERVEGVVPVARRWVCAGSSWEAQICERLPELSKVVAEPIGRDTLPAIALSCAHAYAENPDAVVAFLTSDHVIQPVERFAQALSEAFSIVETDSDTLVTFGVVPTFAATGYGYLELGEALGHGGFAVRRFKEKPDKNTAEKYVARGSEAYLWNSGMFVWSAKRFLQLLAKYEPLIAAAINHIRSVIGTSEYDRILAEIYPTIAKKSVDYGIMEPASLDPSVRIACVPLDLTWMDIGSWNAYAALGHPDEFGNTAMLASAKGGSPAAIFLESTSNTVVSTDPDHLVALFGCDDMVVVHTPDATLVCPKNKAEDLKKLYPYAERLDRG